MKIANIKDKLITLLILLGLLVIFVVFKVPCVVSYFLHIHCPGCGMTRAYLNLLQLNIAGAFNMHPMFWSMPILLVFYLKDWHLFKNKWLNEGILILISLGFIINWIIKFFI